MSKYHAIPVEIDGCRFDSKAEARRYGELKLLQRAGAISLLTFHPTFWLLDPYTRNGAKMRGISYEGDFAYYENGRQIVEDTKGVQTEAFKLKRKLFEARYPDIELRIVQA